MDLTPRPIKTETKLKQIKQEREKPSRWTFLKILREFSTLKQFYPEINPYAEVYKFRDNMYCILYDGLGAAETWNYVIVGPEKAMLIDTSFGLGNLPALVDKITGGKELIVCNTHAHIDHIAGNTWFDRVYCHEYDVKTIEAAQVPDYFDRHAFNEDGSFKYAEFDIKDKPPVHKYEVVGVEDGHIFDLGQGYKVELVHLPGHTPGQSAYFDHQNGCLFIGDVTSAWGEDDDHPEMCTINALRDALLRFQPRFEKVSGIFPGHGTIDLHAVTLQYILEAAQQVIHHPEWSCKDIDFWGTIMHTQYIYQMGSDLKYTDKGVIKEN